MNVNDLKNMEFDKLAGLYSIINEICADYSRMTDGYSLATGDKMFESMPKDIRDMVRDRQRFFEYRNTVKELLKNKITEMFEKQ
jgi:hypothetical protein